MSPPPGPANLEAPNDGVRRAHAVGTNVHNIDSSYKIGGGGSGSSSSRISGSDYKHQRPYGVLGERKRIVVVGAGFGGIAIAARLAAAGHDVTVYEKNDVPGGRCGTLAWEGHRFDIGPSIVLVPDAFRETFNALGERLEDWVELVRVDPAYKIHFQSDGSSLLLTSNLQQMKTQMDSLEKGSFEQLLSYLSEGGVHLAQTLSNIAHRNFDSLLSWFSPQNAALLLKLHVFQKHYDRVSGFFKDPRLRAAFTFQDMYIGQSPYEAPATFSLLQHTELCDGVWYVQGGLYKLVQALEQIAKNHGVKFVYNTAVKQINVDATSKQARGVTISSPEDRGSLHDEEIYADAVIANADLPYVYKCLLPQDLSPPLDSFGRDMDSLRFTSSAICFYWALDKRYPSLRHHNMFLADMEYRESFTQIFGENTLPDQPSFYINVPSRTDPSAAPDDQSDTFFVLVPCGHLSKDRSQQTDLKNLIDVAKAAVLRVLATVGIDDVVEHIKWETVYSPLEWEAMFNLRHGSCFGLAHTWPQLGYLRPHNQHAVFKNLYFVGCSTHPGSGLPNVLVSARLVADRMLEGCDALSSVPSPLAAYGCLLLAACSLAWGLWLRGSGPMSYFAFHTVFSFPLILALAAIILATPKRAGSYAHARRRVMIAGMAVLTCVAFVWALPWDSYLIATKVWTYPPQRVAGTFMNTGVPLEECSYFVLQTLLTGLWCVLVVESSSCSSASVGRVNAERRSKWRSRGVAGLLGIALVGLWMWRFSHTKSTVYLGLILVWAAPICALQWAFAGDSLITHYPTVLRAIVPPTLYLWIADRTAIVSHNIWSISPEYTLQIEPMGLPLEEATFFVVTNMMIIFGLVLLDLAWQWMHCLALDGVGAGSGDHDVECPAQSRGASKYAPHSKAFRSRSAGPRKPSTLGVSAGPCETLHLLRDATLALRSRGSVAESQRFV